MDVQPLEVILVPVDFTEHSFNSVSVAILLCQQQRAQLHLLVVGSPDLVKTPSTTGQLADEWMGNSRIQEENDRIQQLAAQTTQNYQIRCSGSVRVGKTTDELVAAAQALDANLIVMATDHGSDMMAFRLNADAYQVIKTAPCPVLTVPVHKKWPAFTQILFPVRPIPDALDKYEYARKIIRKNNAELTVLALSAPDEIISIQQLKEEIANLQEKLALDEVKNQTLFCPNESMAETVLEKATELNSDLLIITASFATQTDDFFIGPFSQQIIHNAPIPVLAIQTDSGLDV